MFRIAFFALLFGAVSRVYAQEAFSDALHPAIETTPDQAPVESTLLDLRQNTPQNSRPQQAPPWVEAVTLSASQLKGDTSSKSVFASRLRAQIIKSSFSAYFSMTNRVSNRN
jgi:hypothetical protein